MFMLQRIPLHVSLLLNELQCLFDDYGWLHFQSLLLSLILTPYKATVVGMYKILAFGTHRSKHNSFLINSSELLAKALKFYALMILSLLKKHGEPIYFIIDDTSNTKRGKFVQAAFSFFDHTTQRYIWGQQLVCAIILYRDIVIPYAIEIYVPKKQCKSLKQTFQKKTKIAEQFLESFEADSGQEVFVIADSYYATAPLMNHCRRMHYNFVSSLKSNRVFRVHHYTTNVSKYSRSTFRKKRSNKRIRINRTFYHVLSRQVVLKTGGAVKVVFTKRRSHRTVTAVFSTNTALPSKTILQVYAKRWKIEVFFKMSKQHLGLKAYQNRNVHAIRSHVRLSLCAHNLLTHVFINDIRAQGNKLTTKRIAHFSLLQQIDRLRYISNKDTLEYLINQNNHKSRNNDIEFSKYLLAA